MSPHKGLEFKRYFSKQNQNWNIWRSKFWSIAKQVKHFCSLLFFFICKLWHNIATYLILIRIFYNNLITITKSWTLEKCHRIYWPKKDAKHAGMPRIVSGSVWTLIIAMSPNVSLSVRYLKEIAPKLGYVEYINKFQWIL